MKVAWTLCTALALGSLTAASVARAQPKTPAKANVPPKPKALGDTLTGPAKADYDAARVLVNDGDYVGARIKFESAFEASKDPRLLWNLAATEKQLRHYAKAIELLKKFAEAPSALVLAKDRAEATDLVRTQEPFTVAVTFEVSEPGSEIEVDDVVVGTAPLATPVVVDIGQHKVRVHHESFRDFVSSISFGGSAQQAIAVKLEKELHEGKLSVVVPAGATVLIDGQPVVTGPANDPTALKLLSGGHTLRVTASGMRVYEREVVIRDNETRAVEVRLEREPERERPRLRVAVGCGDSEPRGTDDGLTIYVDGSPAATTASGGKKSWSTELGRNRVDYVEYPMDAGTHRVTVRSAGCEPMDVSVNLPEEGADLRGALYSSASFIARGPAGNPNWGRVGIALWFPSSIAGLNQVAALDRTTGSGSLKFDTRATGAMLQPALTFRWFSLGLDFGLATGSASPSAANTFQPADTEAGVESRSGDINWTRLGFRTGLRIPLNVVAFNLGISTGYDHFTVNHLRPGYEWGHPDFAYLGSWSSVDVQVFCDWALVGGATVDGYLKKVIDFDGSVKSAMIGVAFQPNSTCRAERATQFGLR